MKAEELLQATANFIFKLDV